MNVKQVIVLLVIFSSSLSAQIHYFQNFQNPYGDNYDFSPSAPPLDEDISPSSSQSSFVYNSNLYAPILPTNRQNNIFDIVKNNDVEAVRYAVYRYDFDRQEVNSIDEEGKMPLYYAVRNNNLSIVQLLLDKGANVAYIYDELTRRCTILEIALLEDGIHAEIIRSILKKDMQLASCYLSTQQLPKEYAQEKNRQDLVALFDTIHLGPNNLPNVIYGHDNSYTKSNLLSSYWSYLLSKKVLLGSAASLLCGWLWYTYNKNRSSEHNEKKINQ